MERSAVVAHAVERFFEFSLLGLLATGYFAVLGSGYLDVPTAVLTFAGLLLRALLVTGVVRIEFSASLINLATLGYIGFYPIDYVFLSKDFVQATVHLVFFLAIIRILTARTNRDYFFVKLIAFLELMAATILSSNLNFFFFLTLFLMFGVATFCSAEMRRSTQLQRRVVRGGLSGFPWRLTMLTAGVTAGILVLTGGLFFLLPRTAQAAFRHLVSHRYHVPGFSNEITLGQIGQIQQESTVLMHIRIENGGVNPQFLKWRGAAMTEFDGTRWFTPAGNLKTVKVEKGMARLAEAKQQWRQGRRISYEVVMKSMDSDALFFTGVPEFVRIELPFIIRTGVDSYRTGLGGTDGLHYFGFSHLDEQSGAASYDVDKLAPSVREAYLRLPNLDPRIPRLSTELTAGAASELERARSLERYLRTSFGYTTDLLKVPVSDPLAHFLFERKAGHCEYFASSMAVMLRTLGIPSRVVTGFQSGVLNPMTGWYLIRASDAHSWVEAYLPGQGWTTFDPTPPDYRPLAPSLISRLSLLADAAETFWQDWVLNYNLDRQLTLASRIEQGSRTASPFSFMERWNQRARNGWRALAEPTRGVPGAAATLAIAILVLIIASPALWRVLRSHRHARRISRGRVSSNDAAILYARMLAVLKRRGFEKPAWLTPAEFARILPESQITQLVRGFTGAYNELRFGGDREAALRMVSLLKEIETAPRRSVS